MICCKASLTRFVAACVLALGLAAGAAQAQSGACCGTDGTCTAAASSGACTFPSLFVSGGVCASNPCPATGTCCTQLGGCVISFQSTCSTGNVWTAGRTCGPPNPCLPPQGS